MQITLEHLRAAHAAHDPELPQLFARMLEQPAPPTPPPRPESLTFQQFTTQIRSPSFRRLPPEEQASQRQAMLSQLESPDAENPLSPVLRSHEFLMELWESGDGYSRRALLEIIRDTPLVYGPFKGFKQIFKAAEAAQDAQFVGALGAKFDMALTRSEVVGRRTIGYLARRAWRFLRRIGETQPALYPDAAVQFLIHYDVGRADNTWVFNHIFFHEVEHAYSRTRFRLIRSRHAQGNQVQRPASLRKHRAFDELWRRSPRPLFALLEQARNAEVLSFAAESLRSDFRASLREVEPAWVGRLITAKQPRADEFVIWLLDNTPTFEHARFRDLGLHDSVLQLLNSESRKATQWAVAYVRTHARDLPNEKLVELINSHDKSVRNLGKDLLRTRDPRKEVGLEVWGDLLASAHGFKIAEQAILKSFGRQELTLEWFGELFLAPHDEVADFAAKNLYQVHPKKSVPASYFVELIDNVTDSGWQAARASQALLDKIEKPSELSEAALQQLLLHPMARSQCVCWVNEGAVAPQQFGVPFLKAIAYQPSFVSCEAVQQAKTKSWGQSLSFDESLAASIFRWLQDARQFMPDDLGFAWLLELVQRSEPLYHDFAVTTLTKMFLPADFADSDQQGGKPTDEPSSDDSQVDLDGASFLFTGKLNTMTRSEAKAKVTAAGGANSSSVTKKLDYLVIGDDGSPLYGQGRKGSKQTKAEDLNESEAEIKIISETAFLQMLAGEQREFSADDVAAGCERLWSMMVEAEHPDEPLAKFARVYIRRHHPDICLAETDRPVDPGAEVPPEFLTFQRVKPLFHSKFTALRELALELSHWEFARWSPPIDGIVELCDSPYPAVRQFVTLALTCADEHEHRRYRIKPDVLTADAVYSFCESRTLETRKLGMELIGREPRLRVPEELFRLTESPDAAVRAFVIRTFWSLYRSRGVKPNWKPTPPPERLLKKRKDKQSLEERIGSGPPAKPDLPPADPVQLHALLRRMLFQLPPGPPPRDPSTAAASMIKLRPLPARQGKLKLIETLRDLAMEDAEFANNILPLLREFKASRGKSEQAACIVAVTRIQHAHPQLIEEHAAAE